MTRARGDKLLLARVLDTDRPAGRDGQVAGCVLYEDLLFAAKPTANAGLDDADALDRQAQNGGKYASSMERHLCGSADHQPVILVPIGDDHMWLNGRLLHLRNKVLALEDVVGLRKTLVHIPDIDEDVRSEVARPI